MGRKYRFTRYVDPSSRPDSVQFESPSADHPEGRFLHFEGEAEELTDDQYVKLSRFIGLTEVTDEDEADTQFLAQPGLEGRESTSTDNPPQPGAVPDLSGENKQALVDRIEARGGGFDGVNTATGLDVNKGSSKEDLAAALNADYAARGV